MAYDPHLTTDAEYQRCIDMGLRPAVEHVPAYAFWDPRSGWVGGVLAMGLCSIFGGIVWSLIMGL